MLPIEWEYYIWVRSNWSNFNYGFRELKQNKYKKRLKLPTCQRSERFLTSECLFWTNVLMKISWMTQTDKNGSLRQAGPLLCQATCPLVDEIFTL